MAKLWRAAIKWRTQHLAAHFAKVLLVKNGILFTVSQGQNGIVQNLVVLSGDEAGRKILKDHTLTEAVCSKLH